MNTAPTAPNPNNTTAYALGELTGAERADFEKILSHDSALAAQAEETKAFCALLEKNLALPTIELQQAAKSRVLFEADKPRRDSVIVRHKWMKRITLAAACVAVGSVTTWWLMPRQYGEQSSQPDVFATALDPRKTPAANYETLAKQIREQEAVVEQTRMAMNDLAKKHSIVDRVPLSVGAGYSPVIERGVFVPEAASTADTQKAILLAKNPPELNGPSSSLSTVTSAITLPNVTSAPASAPPLVAVNETMSAGLGAGGGMGGGRGRGRGAGIGNGFGPGSGPGFVPAPSKSKEYASAPVTGDFDGESARYYEERRREQMPADSPVTPGTESYKATPENPFLKVPEAPLSTFSIDVDTASYSNVRRFLNTNQAPPPAAVRLEELVNYFPYDYAPPVDGKPFAVHVELTSAPWDETHRLARIALKGKEIHPAERPAANLVFLVDVSGSMDSPVKLPLVKQSLRFVVERLTEKDTVSLVTYAGESGVALPATKGADKARIMAAIDGLGAGGSTNGAGGITTAYQQAAIHFNKEGINRVILATDGDFNVGVTSHDALLKLIEEKRKTGVFLSLLGYGMGNTKDDTMELLANKGNGNYAYIDSLSEARKALGEQFSGTLVTIAKDVKIQIEFNPAVIRSYRLLGYENRMLAAKDFKDDTKDAGEIGAGHTVTALYELVPVGAPEPQVAVDDLKYAPKPAAEPAPPVPGVPAEVSGETMTVKLRWKAPDSDVSTPMEVPVKDTGAKIDAAGPETKWAVAVAGFAAMLNGSQFNGLTWDGIRTLAKAGKGADPHGYRGEFLQLLDRAESVARR